MRHARNALSLPLIAICCLALLPLNGCSFHKKSKSSSLAKQSAINPKIKPGTPLKRTGDEIIVAGQLFHTGVPVVLWTDPGGFDAYRTERRFSPWGEASFRATTQAATTQKSIEITNPARVRIRQKVMTPAEIEVARGGPPLSMVQDKVDQFVIHYDVAGTSANCFKVLHDQRALSVQFMLDIDGTIYQSCDLKDACAHATKANDRSIGIEIANLGSYGSGESPLYKRWYDKDENGKPYIKVPESLQKYIRTPNFVGRPARDEMIVGEVQGRTQRQYDFTPEQYASLTRLVATVCTVLPKIECDYPRDEQGKLVPKALTQTQWENYHGVLGHYHVQTNKSDPGPAFQWDTIIDNARKMMGKPAKSMAGSIRPDPTSKPTTKVSKDSDSPTTAPANAPATAPASSQPAPVSSAAPTVSTESSLASRLDEILSRRNKGDTHYVSRVIDLETGKELYAHDIDTPVMPASNGKLCVSAATLDRFGSSHVFKTYLAMDGDDLWLIGTGDPSPGDSRMAKAHGGTTVTILDQWADALKSKGISQIKGNLYYYAGTFDDETIHPSWSKGYLTDWYAAPVTGLNFNDNCVDISLKPTAKGQLAEFTLVPSVTNIKVVNGVATREGDGPAAKIDREQDANVYTLSGAVEKPTELESKPVIDPAAFFADALRTHLKSRGIEIAGETKRAAKPLGNFETPPKDNIVAVYESKMPEVIARINKQSQNLFAEAFCKMLGRQWNLDHVNDAPGSWKSGSDAVHAFLKEHHIDDSKLIVADGSGLSRENRVTARIISDLFVMMSKHKDADTFRNSLAAAGVDGTIGKRMKDLAGRVFAKTGYIGGVRSLSGYVKTRDDKWLVFSIIYNGIDGDVKPYEELQDEAVHLLAEWPNLPAANSTASSRAS